MKCQQGCRERRSVVRRLFNQSGSLAWTVFSGAVIGRVLAETIMLVTPLQLPYARRLVTDQGQG